MLTLVVTYSFPSERTTQAEGFLRDLIAGSRSEPGCRRYDVFRSSDHAGTFLIFEQYDDETALAAHRATEHFARAGTNGIQAIAHSRSANIYGAFDEATGVPRSRTNSIESG